MAGGSLKDAYLMLYNRLCSVGWALVLSLALQAFFKGLSTDNLPDSIPESLGSILERGNEGLAPFLYTAQLAALMEIVHAMFGLVRSPVMVTAMQVGSRICAIYALYHSPEAQAQWGAGLMMISWALVEVPRYAFYVAAISAADDPKREIPYLLFWLRYSLFAILYPTGIVGELTVFLAASQDPVFIESVPSFVPFIYSTILPLIYVVGSPFMIYNMAMNRKKAFKKRFAKPVTPRGLVFPVSTTRGSVGERASTPVAKKILAAAVGATNRTKAEMIQYTRNWRWGYVEHFVGMVEEQCASPTAALAIAKAGLDEAYNTFQFVAPDGSSVSLGKAMEAKNTEKFFTGFVTGQNPKFKNKNELAVPYKGETLTGQALKDQVKAWVDYGTIEPDAGNAIIKCIDNPNWLDLSDRHFVLLGAGSAMGPFLVLMALGANVIAIDLDRPNIWKRLITIAKESSGSLTFPMKVEQKSCADDDALYAASGCNLFTETPMIRDWLLDLYPGKPFTVGSYAYLDGAAHVQVSLAMDAICRDLSEKRKGTSLAYLCTPTDIHLVPQAAHDASEANFEEYCQRQFCIIMNMMSRGEFLKKNAEEPFPGKGGPFNYVNGLSQAQGPNYALAKRMQHWRAIIARSKGCIVSSNVAPATSTVSVVHNRTFAWAYEGMPYFKPYEIFAPETSNAVMSALLLSDLNDPKSAGNPKNELKNPNQLFENTSFNGGAWRCAYTVDSIGEASVLVYFSRIAMPYVGVATAVSVASGAVAAKYFGWF